jgi:hypothetical protein
MAALHLDTRIRLIIGVKKVLGLKEMRGLLAIPPE